MRGRLYLSVALCAGVCLFCAVPLLTAQEESGVISYKDAEKYLDQKKTVEGTITGTYLSERSGNLYLNFGDYKTELSIKIPGEDIKKFPSDAQTMYKDKKVQATGMIKKERKKLRMVVADPADLKIVE